MKVGIQFNTKQEMRYRYPGFIL